MNTESPAEKLAPNFTLAFQQMASFVAIAKTRNTAQVLDELIQQCFSLLPSDPLGSAQQISDALQYLFGIRINTKDVQAGILRLQKALVLADIGSGHLSLTPEAKAKLSARITEAGELEREVRETWIKQVHSTWPLLDEEKLWLALRNYLASAFRRHGIQAVELVANISGLPVESKQGLSGILDNVISKSFPELDRVAARDAIGSFFATVGGNRRRAEYVASLADGAYNYFSLAVAPEVSEKLRGKLNELTLFLDTNFLFGILNLHANSQVDVSSELLDSIGRFKLPFRLRYHEATTREMTNTLYHYGKELKKQKWSQKISRAVVASESLSGIELRYHEKNLAQPISSEDFLAPYDHWQVLLKDRGIDVYNVISSESRLRERADLEADYRDYLQEIQREKPTDAIQHDMAVLETVRSLRSSAKSTLEAGHLLVTCDYHLFRFDVEDSKKNGRKHCTVLPSLLWQILRPFVSDSDDFDKAFAETFALPEFSLAKGGAQKAAAKMASILAGYSNIPEETASKMLANDLLIAELQSKHTDEEFIKTVESAIVAENDHLIEERAALISQAALEREQREQDLIKASDEIAIRDRAIAEMKETISKIEMEKEAKSRLAGEWSAKFSEEQEQKKRVEGLLSSAKLEANVAETKAAWLRKIVGVVLGIFGVAIFQIVIHVIGWKWLSNHPSAIGIEGCISVFIFSIVVGTIVRAWRKEAFVAGGLGAVFVLLQIAGGYSDSPKKVGQLPLEGQLKSI